MHAQPDSQLFTPPAHEARATSCKTCQDRAVRWATRCWLGVHTAWVTALILSLSVTDTAPELCAAAESSTTNRKHGPFSYGGHGALSQLIDLLGLVCLALLLALTALAALRSRTAPIGWVLANAAIGLAGLFLAMAAAVSQIQEPIWCSDRRLVAGLIVTGAVLAAAGATACWRLSRSVAATRADRRVKSVAQPGLWEPGARIELASS
jgi:hypothetical protein